MKSTLTIILLLIINSVVSNQSNSQSSLNMQSFQIPFASALPGNLNLLIKEPEKSLERIRGYIYDYASRLNTPIYIKRMKYGHLPDGYDIRLIRQAEHDRLSNKWNKVMNYPTEIWRSCLYSPYPSNYEQLCNNQYALNANPMKLNGCKHNFCLVCCDNFKLSMTKLANSHPSFSRRMGLFSYEGFANLSKVISKDEIEKCRTACDHEYPWIAPPVLPPPPRDHLLGKNPENAAVSCLDIKQYGDSSAASGEYWLTLSSKGKIKVFCDMDTDGGGWTLVFNYNHLPGQLMELKATSLPKNLSTNGHMSLHNAGFTKSDVVELRFFCFESFNGENKFIHFKTSDTSFINTAFDGNHQHLQLGRQFKMTDLPPPIEISQYSRSIGEYNLRQLDYVGTSRNGNFIDTAFGNTTKEAYWTVRGLDRDYPVYECGSYHRYNSGSASSELGPNMVRSYHSVFIRGKPLDQSIAQRRFYSKMK